MNDRTEQFTELSAKKYSWTASLAFHAILTIAFINYPSDPPNNKKHVDQHQQELSFANVVWEEKPVSNNIRIKSEVRGWVTTPESLLEREMNLDSGNQLNKIERVIDNIVAKNKLPNPSQASVIETELNTLQGAEVTKHVGKNIVNSNLQPPIESEAHSWKTTPESLLEREMNLDSGDKLNKIERVIDNIVARKRSSDHSHASIDKAEQEMPHTVEGRSSVQKDTVTGNLKLPIRRPRFEKKDLKPTAFEPSDNIAKKPLKNENNLSINNETLNPKVENVETKYHQSAGLKNRARSSRFRTSDVLASLGSIRKGINSDPSLAIQTNRRTTVKPLASMPPVYFDTSKQSNVCQKKQLVAKKQIVLPETRAKIDFILRRHSNYQNSPMTVDKLLSQSGSGPNKYKRVTNSMTLEQLLEIANRQEVSFICVD